MRAATVWVPDFPAGEALNVVRLATADASLETDMVARGSREL